MKLVAIELVGFKSFADRTKIILDEFLTVIVGPNGCGKSNIIDAICWVIGENSPRYLRGESSTDVIFKGSQQRAPLAYASVELQFEDCLGVIQGELGQYESISIRRKIDREGQSQYFINQTRCRRRDVVDIFLGTGLGPRSYAIISQGMIAKIVEAKPDDLRQHLEEVAGIAKFKERKAETLRRIKQARENSQRLNDIIQELKQQLNHLQRQAEIAKRYRELRASRRSAEVTLLQHQWSETNIQKTKLEAELKNHTEAMEDQKANQWRLTSQLDEVNLLRQTDMDSFQEVQQGFYQQCQEVATLEQKIASGAEKKEALLASQNKSDHQISELNSALEQDRALLAESLQCLADKEAKLTQLKAQLAAKKEDHAKTEQTYVKANHHYQAIIKQRTILESDRRHAAASLTRLEASLEQDKAELSLLHGNMPDLSSLKAALHHAEQNVEASQYELTQKQANLTKLQGEFDSARLHFEQTQAEVQKCQSRLDALQARLSSQQSLQAYRAPETAAWYAQQGVTITPLLAALTVKEGWHDAVEVVLEPFMNAHCLDDDKSLLKALSKQPAPNLSWVQSLTNKTNNKQAQGGAFKSHDNLSPLAELIESDFDIEHLLAGVYYADSYEQALGQRKLLRSGESIITKEGVWLGRYWLRTPTENKSDSLSREQTIRSLENDQSSLLASHQKLLEQLKHAETDKLALKAQLDKAVTDLETAKQTLHQSELTRLKHQSDDQQAKQLRQSAQAQLQSIQERIKTTEREMLTVTKSMRKNEASTRVTELNKLASDLDQYQAVMQAAQSQYEEAKSAVTLLESEINNLTQTTTLMTKSITRHEHMLADLNQSERTDQDELVALVEQDKSLRQALETALSEKQRLSDDLVNQEKIRQKHDAQIKSIEFEIKAQMDVYEAQQQASQACKLSLQACESTLSHVLRQLEEKGSGAPKTQVKCDPEKLSHEIEQVKKRLDRMGPINLAAIEEVKAIETRMSYLTKQHDDLCDSMQMLEQAIASIDKETKQKFMTTFKQVSQNFAQAFPTLFGGGRACLSLTSDDLFTCGVKIEAQPPGKQNSTIHLLSGGEKTLAALALIFALFNYHPAPFCLLDEVDAPLDENNVMRFRENIKKMSKQVQLVMISHNKKTIPVANQLIGITMNEPGVSKHVSVSIEKALAMAEQ